MALNKGIKPLNIGFPPLRNPLPVVLIFFALMAGCATILSPVPKEPSPPKESVPEKTFPLVRLDQKDYPTFSDSMNFDNLEYGIRNSLVYLRRKSPNELIYFGQDPYKVSHLIQSLIRFQEFIRQKPSVEELNRFISANFRVYRSNGKAGGGEVLFTGYFEPFLSGSLVKTKRYRYPVYALPKDLISIDLSQFSKELTGKRITGRFNGKTIVPYYSRSEIETNPNFAQKATPIAWVADRVELFFLHVQGSGQIHLTNGQTIHVHYHGVNGRAYRSIGKLLIDQGKISAEEMSMQKIKSYLNAHPKEMDTVLHYNTSFVFFKTEIKGPLGYLGVPLTPGRSAAFDRKLFPPGALAFISTQIPTVDGNMAIANWNDHKVFVLNQDTGGAIKGAGRTDLFWGSGPYAEVAAGHLKSPGELYFLILNPPSI